MSRFVPIQRLQLSAKFNTAASTASPIGFYSQLPISAIGIAVVADIANSNY